MRAARLFSNFSDDFPRDRVTGFALATSFQPDESMGGDLLEHADLRHREIGLTQTRAFTD